MGREVRDALGEQEEVVVVISCWWSDVRDLVILPMLRREIEREESMRRSRLVFSDERCTTTYIYDSCVTSNLMLDSKVK